ncbi:hypothetical protein C8F01DRAFT_1162429 [Mycena amicta]|nr:hypothetical protein C8F01DRAFT_1162429 [Mycena amicta]
MTSTFSALFIGIDEYACPGIPTLRGCSKDVDSFRDALLLRCPQADIHTLTNQSATRKGIIETFQTHLTENPQISKNDAILVYFAGYGQRYDAASRQVDALIPHDYGPDVPGIFDATLHGLLLQLVEKKGANVTLILDCCFSKTVALSSVRRIREPAWSSHLAQFRSETDFVDYEGLFTDAQPYVLISASRRNMHCTESEKGGVFTQTISSIMRSSWPLSCRELVVLTQKTLATPRGQTPACHGQHLDRVLFTIPRLCPVEKLRVFSADLDLDGPSHSLDGGDFRIVSRKRDASVVVYRLPEGRRKIERRQGLPAQYGSAEVDIEIVDAATVLDGIAHFNHYLALNSGARAVKATWLMAITSWLRRLFRWEPRSAPKPFVELYHFNEDEDGNLLGDVSPNILRNGVAHLEAVPREHKFGLKITNDSEQPTYPYLVHFDTATYAVKVLYSPFPQDARVPPKSLQPHSCLVFGRLPDGQSSPDSQPSLRILFDEERVERTAEIIKVILSEKPIDVGYMAQPSPMLVPPSNPRPRPVPAEIPGVWQTETLTLAVPANYRSVGNTTPKSGVWGVQARICSFNPFRN